MKIWHVPRAGTLAVQLFSLLPGLLLVTNLAVADCMDDCKRAFENAYTEMPEDNTFESVWKRIKSTWHSTKECMTGCLRSVEDGMKHLNPLPDAHGEEPPGGVRMDVHPTGRAGDVDNIRRDALKLLRRPGS